jgi:hypothetical protein
MLRYYTTTERILFAIGLLLSVGVPFLVNGHYLPISHFWGGVLGGVGIGVMIGIFLRVARRRKQGLPKP